MEKEQKEKDSFIQISACKPKYEDNDKDDF